VGGDCLRKVETVCSIGSKRVRYCVLQEKEVSCHGVCRGAFVFESFDETQVVMCPIYVEAFDLAVNCGDKAVRARLNC
jgi:hypothetical protein